MSRSTQDKGRRTQAYQDTSDVLERSVTPDAPPAGFKFDDLESGKLTGDASKQECLRICREGNKDDLRRLLSITKSDGSRLIADEAPITFGDIWSNNTWPKLLAFGTFICLLIAGANTYNAFSQFATNTTLLNSTSLIGFWAAVGAVAIGTAITYGNTRDRGVCSVAEVLENAVERHDDKEVFREVLKTVGHRGTAQSPKDFTYRNGRNMAAMFNAMTDYSDRLNVLLEEHVAGNPLASLTLRQFDQKKSLPLKYSILSGKVPEGVLANDVAKNLFESFLVADPVPDVIKNDVPRSRDFYQALVQTILQSRSSSEEVKKLAVDCAIKFAPEIFKYYNDSTNLGTLFDFMRAEKPEETKKMMVDNRYTVRSEKDEQILKENFLRQVRNYIEVDEVQSMDDRDDGSRHYVVEVSSGRVINARPVEGGDLDQHGDPRQYRGPGRFDGNARISNANRRPYVLEEDKIILEDVDIDTIVQDSNHRRPPQAQAAPATHTETKEEASRRKMQRLQQKFYGTEVLDESLDFSKDNRNNVRRHESGDGSQAAQAGAHRATHSTQLEKGRSEGQQKKSSSDEKKTTAHATGASAQIASRKVGNESRPTVQDVPSTQAGRGGRAQPQRLVSEETGLDAKKPHRR